MSAPVCSVGQSVAYVGPDGIERPALVIRQNSGGGCDLRVFPDFVHDTGESSYAVQNVIFDEDGADGTFYTANVDAARAILFEVSPDAPAVDELHADFTAAEDEVSFPGPFTDPDVPRNIAVDFAALYDGGDITVTGTDEDDDVIDEEFTAVAGSQVVGTKIFKTVTAAVRSLTTEAASAVSIGYPTTGNLIGLGAVRPVDDFGILTVDGTTEEVIVDSTAGNENFSPDTEPDGSRVFVILVNSRG
jgi:hypothetical protein